MKKKIYTLLFALSSSIALNAQITYEYDNTFDGDGVKSAAPYLENTFSKAVLLDDGTIWGHYFYRNWDNYMESGVQLFQANGTLNTSFSTDGISAWSSGYSGSAYQLYEIHGALNNGFWGSASSPGSFAGIPTSSDYINQIGSPSGYTHGSVRANDSIYLVLRSTGLYSFKNKMTTGYETTTQWFNSGTEGGALVGNGPDANSYISFFCDAFGMDNQNRAFVPCVISKYDADGNFLNDQLHLTRLGAKSNTIDVSFALNGWLALENPSSTPTEFMVLAIRALSNGKIAVLIHNETTSLTTLKIFPADGIGTPQVIQLGAICRRLEVDQNDNIFCFTSGTQMVKAYTESGANLPINGTNNFIAIPSSVSNQGAIMSVFGSSINANGDLLITGNFNKPNQNGTATAMIKLKRQQSSGVGINENSKVIVTAYPNPAFDFLQISGLSNDEKVSIVDMSGRIIKSCETENGALQLDGLDSGNYLIHFTNSTQLTPIRFVKK